MNLLRGACDADIHLFSSITRADFMKYITPRPVFGLSGLSFSPLSLLVALGVSMYGSTAMAAFLPPPTGAGQLNNQLRQQDRTVPPAPVAPSISLPAGEHGSARAPESTARVTLKAVTFTGMAPVPGTHRVTEASLQKVVAPWLNRPLSFGDLQAMTDAVTRHYRDHGALVARAILPPQTIKDGVLTVKIIP
ncbi:POTRA domain-containing protein, partial [Salmonella sp. SG203]|uniref:POTRA domain-containing protein n=1 Tax=Salmonella sp. SG203 TaxID=2555397 RepID=UPI002672C48D